MKFREAGTTDIRQIQVVRNSVKENMLSHPSVVTDAHCELYLSQRGKGWVCEEEDHIVGFSIVDLEDHNVWALFIHPDFEKRGAGRKLHDIMINWYFSITNEKISIHKSRKILP
jgi:hypothetical protein